MIMFPAHRNNLSANNSFGGYGDQGCGFYDCIISLGERSDLMADQDGSKSDISTTNEEATSKDNINQEINKDEDDDGGWLRLSLGSGHHRPPPNHQISLGSRTVELDLLPLGSGSTDSGTDETWSLTLSAPPQHDQLSFQVANFRPITAPPPPPTFDSVSPMIFTYNQQHDNSYLPLRPYFPLTTLSSPSSFPASFHRPPIRIDFRVVDPPPRPNSGVWFSLQASQNQTKEPYLPQVPKSYLRIKDRRTTVGSLIKYLVYKLKLDGEFEIGITCKGQQLLPILTLQHVRDNIWNRPRNDVVFLNSSSSIDHLMVLNYGRIA